MTVIADCIESISMFCVENLVNELKEAHNPFPDCSYGGQEGGGTSIYAIPVPKIFS